MLYSFVGHPDGFYPTGSLVADKTGHLYGTTTLGGGIAVCRCGAVFELTPPAKPGGTWTETILYSFHGGSNDGKLPYGALAFDKVGNLYGTTQGGGPNNTGTVFKLTPPVTQGGVWTETVLFFFASDGSQGSWPSGKLVFGGPGNLYRTTEGGGANSSCSCGTVFELKPPATQGGAWTESLLYSFGSVAADGLGLEPAPGLILRGGAFYGTTQIGGTNEVGTVFQLLQTNGTWTENILYNFPGGSGGASPLGGLISDTAGNLYGTVRAGGTTNSDCFDGCEAVFELSPPAVTGNPWQETTLYASPAARTVAVRWAGVVRDKLGNAYGTTSVGGVKNTNSTGNNGVIFELSPPAVAGGAWTESVLHAFGGSTLSDGRQPVDDLILVNGRLYGTTWQGRHRD